MQKIYLSFFTLLALALFSCENLQNNHDETSKEPDATAAAMATATKTIDKEDNNQTALTYGVDLSKFQGNEIDVLDKQKEGLYFVICKATEGITYTDPDFQHNWSTIPTKGFVRGAYHFYRSADDPGPQADNFINAIKDLQATDLPPIVDFEGAGIDQSQSVEDIQKNLITFINKVSQALDRKLMIYTDIPTGNKYLNNPSFSTYALWIALYEDLEKPVLPDAWKGQTWRFWQKSSSHEINGEKNDFDVFNGDMEALQSFIQTY